MTNTRTSSRSGVAVAMPWLILLVGLVATVIVYWPGLGAPLMFEDVSTLEEYKGMKENGQDLSLLQAIAVSDKDMGLSNQPLERMSFLFDVRFLDEGSFGSRVVNLLIHMLNGILIFILLRQLLRFDSMGGELTAASPVSRVLMALVVTGWLLHPLNLTNVMVLAQRGTLLSTLFVLSAFVAYVQGRLTSGMNDNRTALIWFTCALLAAVMAALSGEAVLILPLALFLFEWLVPLDPEPRSGAQAVRHPDFVVFAWLGVSLLALGVGIQFFSGSWAEVEARGVSQLGLALTEARAAVYYLGLLILPRPSELGLFHDDIPWSVGLLSPPSGFLAVAVLMLIVVTAVVVRRKHRLVSFGLLVYLAAHFAGAWLAPGDILEEYRTYLPSIGVLLAVTAGLMSSKRLTLSSEIRILVIGIFCIFFGVVSHGRVLAWQNENRLAMTLLNNHPASARSNYAAASIFVELSADPLVAVPDRDLFRQKAVDHYLEAARLQPNDAGALLAVLLMEGLEKQRDKESFLNNLLGGGSTAHAVPLEIDKTLLSELPQRLKSGIPSRLEMSNLVQVSRCERLGRCYFEPGHVDGLFSAMLNNSRLEVSHDLAALLDEAAVRELGRGNLDKAQTLLERALSIDPGNPMFRLNRATVLFSVGKHDQALEIAKSVASETHEESVLSYANQLRDSFSSASRENASEP